MVGIEKMKDAAKVVIDLGVKLEDALEDGKLTFVEGLTIVIGAVPAAFGLVQDAAELKAEFLDLDDAERDELVDYVVETLDLKAENVEAIAEAGFEVLISLDNLVRTVKEAQSTDELPI